ncbi:MAG: hypothetical protein WAN50_00390 [Minisyncoccia bacterium]
MITRKAIAAAFEVITNDKTVKTVVMFCDLENTFNRIQSVRVTRIRNNGQSFYVRFGRCNFAEREYLKKFGRLGKPLPKCWIIPVKKKKS